MGNYVDVKCIVQRNPATRLHIGRPHQKWRGNQSITNGKCKQRTRQYQCQLVVSYPVVVHPDGSITSYTWSKVSGPACTITTTKQLQTTVNWVDTGKLPVSIIVTDK